MKKHQVSVVIGFSVVLLIIASSGFVHAQTTGKTFGNEVKFLTPPNLRLVSEDSVNGKPKFDYFILVKAKLNGVYDINGGLQTYETFNVGQIDVWGNDNTNRFWMDMHQSQLRFRGQRETEMGTLIGYVEGDFWGGSKHFRLRHAWVDFKFIHFGQDWSFFGDKDIWPNVLDWDGPPSGVWRRAPELKFYFDVAENSRFDIGLGSPGAEVMFSSDIDPAATVSSANQRVPDVIAAFKQTTSFGHIRITGIFRNLQYTSGTLVRTVPGYGATISGLVRTSNSLPSTLQFQAVAGAGIGTYLASFGGYNFDAVPTANGEIEAIQTAGAWAAYEHYLSKQWHFNLIGGVSAFRSPEISSYNISTPGYTAANSKISLDMLYGLVNLMFDPVPNLVLGIEYNYGYKKSTHEGAITTGEGTVSTVEQSRPANRISFGLFFDF